MLSDLYTRVMKALGTISEYFRTVFLGQVAFEITAVF
jgi:hypothetical protein